MPILDQNSLEFISRGTDYTRRVGIRLGTILNGGDVICLQGDLGSGKTVLVQGMAAGWGSLDRVTSPTFVLVNLYRRLDGGQFHHLDAYQLDNARELQNLTCRRILKPVLLSWNGRIGYPAPCPKIICGYLCELLMRTSVT